MRKHSRMKTLIVVSFCLSVAIAGPLSPLRDITDYPVDEVDDETSGSRTNDAKCSSHCPQRSTPWSYEVGSTYTYRYSTETSTAMKIGTSDPDVKLKLQADVEVTVNTPCDFSLKLSQVKLTEGINTNTFSDFTENLEIHEVHFSFVDGRIVDVCSSPDESTQALNIKKGILSAFQMSSDDWSKSQNITETDVIGICSTEYIPTGVNVAGQSTFQKVKDMKTCKYNQKLFQFALNLPDLNIQQLSLLESNHVCELQVHEGRLSKSVCQESHIFRPFSSGEHGATTSQEQTLVFVEQSVTSKLAPSRGLSKRGNLLYDHHADAKDAESNQAIVTQILSEYATSDESQRPELFTALVHSLRHLPHSQLAHIFYKITDFSTRKFMLDAIPLLRTDAAVTLMRDIVESGQLNDVTLDNWFASLAFYKNPTRAMITTSAAFLGDSPRESALLAISSLVRTFCESQTNCQQLPEVQDIILRYEQILGVDCGGEGTTLEGEDEDRIILSLKGLRNIGHTIRSGPILEKCYLEKTNSMYIRLAALDTLKMLSCKSKVHEASLVNTFADTENDSELRIGAYLAIMNCPTESTIETVKRVLTSEPVNQVGSFVWTHLTNLQESQSLSPSKIFAKKMVGDRFLKNKWNTDVRKFSRYFETSYYAKELQVGATVEGNLIFSQESYLPRSAMVNLTINVFGENLNLLEVGGRAEGFEPLVEGIFGPDGRFREDTFHKLLQGMRNKRDTSDMTDFQSTFNTLREDKPKGNFYVRSFGRDTHYSSFHGINELFNKVSVWPNNLFGSNWNGNDIDFRRSSIFLDGSIVVPTASGLPLKLSVNGTSTIGLKSSTKLDVANFFNDGKLSFEAHVFPSATVQVTGLLEVHAGIAKTGLKSVNKLHSSTFLDGKVQIDGGKLAKVEMNMPRDTMEILEASADFYIWQPTENQVEDAYKPLESDNELERYIGCSTDGNDLFGVELCAVAKYYYVPGNDLAVYFTGPSLAKLSLKKTDQFQKYVFEYSWSTKAIDETNNKLVNDIKVTYDTPGSAIVRRSSLELKFDDVLSFVSVGVEIPINKINADLVYHWTAEKKMLKAGLAVDRKNVLFIYSIFKVADSQGRYGAEARITYYDADFLRWVGTVVLQDKRKSLDLKLEGSLHNPIKLTGDLYTSQDRYDLTSALRSSVVSIDFAGQLRHTDTSLSVKADANYKMASIGSHKINFDGGYQMGSLGKLLKHHAHISINPSQFPSLNTDLTWDTQLSSDYLENSGKLRIGSRAYNIEQVFSSQANDQMQELLFKLAITDAINNLEYKIDFLHKIGTMESNNRIALSFHRHHMEAYVTHKMTASPSTSLNISAGLTFPGGHSYAAGFEVAQQQSNDFAGKTFVRWGSEEEPDKKISADFSLQKGNEAYINYGFSVTLTLPNLQTMASTGTLIFDPAAGSILHLSWSRNHRHYSAEIEYSVVDLEHQVNATLTINNVEYKATIRASDREVKSIVVEVMANKHYYLEAQAKDNFKNMKLDIFWDKTADDTKSLSLKSELTARELDLRFRLLENKGEMYAQLVDEGLKAEARYNDHFVKAKASHSHEAANYGLEGEVSSSFDAIKDVRLVARVALLKNSENVAVLDSKMLFKWNDIHHSLIVTGEKATKLRAQLITSSTYAPLDDCIVNLEHEKSGKEINTLLEASYQKQNMTFELWHSGAKAKEGHVKLTTPFQALENIYAEYKLTLGKEIHYVAKFDHNNGANAIDVDASGHLRSGDVDLKANARHTWGDDVAIGVTFKSDKSDAAIGANLKIGESRGFNISGAVASNPDRISGISAVFQIMCPSHPVDFNFRYIRPKTDKLELQSKLIANNKEFFIASVTTEGDNNDGGFFDSSILIVDSQLDVRAEFFSNNSDTLFLEKRFLNATFTRDGEMKNNLFISTSIRNAEEETENDTTYVYNVQWELKLTSPDGLESGLSMSKTDSPSTGLSEFVLVGQGLEQKFDFSIEKERSIEPQGETYRLDLKTSLEAASHLKLDMKSTRELFDLGYVIQVIFRGNINDAEDDILLTSKYVLENEIDQSITITFDGLDNDKFLISGVWRESIDDTTQFEFVYVDEDLREQKYFVSYYQKDSDVKIFANTSSTYSDPIQMNIGLRVYEDDTSRFQGTFQIQGSDVWLDVLLDLEDDDMNGYTASGSIVAPRFGIDEKKHIRGALYYGRGVLLRAAFKVEENSNNLFESTILFDMGIKNTPKRQYFIKLDAKSTLEIEEKKNKFVNFEGILSGSFDDLRVTLQSSCDQYRDVKLIANVGDSRIEAKLVHNDNTMSALAELSKESGKLGLNSHLESTFHSFGRIDLTGKVDIENSPKNVEISAKTGDQEHTLEIMLMLEESKGSLKVNAVLPIIGVEEKDLQIRYNLSPQGGDAIIKVRGNDYDIHWEIDRNDVTATVSGSFPGFRTVQLNGKFDTRNQQSADISVNVDNVLTWHIKSSIDTSNYAISLKLKTPYQSLSALELNAGIIQNWRGFNCDLTYRDESLGSAKVFLSQDFHEGQLILAYKSSNSVKLEYNLKGDDKYIRVHHIGYYHALLDLNCNTVVGKAIASLNTFWTGDHTTEVVWNLSPVNGMIKATVKCEEHEMIVATKYNKDETFKGVAEFEATNVPGIRTLSTVVTFDVGEADKKVNILTKWNKNTFDHDLSYRMTEDTFDGTLVVKTSVRRWEMTTFKAKYNISARPSASVSYEKDGIKKEILVEVALDNRKPVPTIYITTPFTDYENLILGGDVTSRDSRYTADFYVSSNGQKIIVFANKVTTKPDFSTFELVSTLITPIENWKSLLVEFGFKTKDPWAGKIKFVRDGVEYSLKGKISINDREFKLNAITPFEDFESIGLSGKFGTTSVGKQFGVSFEQNTVRRDVSFEYGVSPDNVATLQLTTPLRSARSIKVQSSIMSDDPSEKLNFGFETSGEENAFAFGLMYDFSRGITNGKLRIHINPSLIIEAPPFDVNIALDEHDSEYSGKLQLSMGGVEFVSAQTSYRAGHAAAVIKTPVPDYETILIELESDFASKITLLFELNGVASSVSAVMEDQQHFKIVVKTPVVGYELVTANYDVLPDGKISIVIERSGVRLTTLLIGTDISASGGKIDIDWKATANIWATLKAEYKSGKGLLNLKTASTRLKNVNIEFDIQPGDPKTSYSLIADCNEHHLDYKSYVISKEGLREGWSELNTNIELIGVGKRVTTYKLQFSSDLSTPFSIAYKVVQDGKIDIDIDASIDIKLTSGFDLKIYFNIPDIIKTPIDIKAALIGDIAGPQKSGKLTASYTEGTVLKYSLAVDGKLSDKDFVFMVKTNNPSFSELKGKVTWATDAGNKTKLTLALILNGGKFLQASATFDRNPFTRIIISVQKDEATKQEIDIRWNAKQNDPSRRQLLVASKGIVESKFEVNFNHNEFSTHLDITVMVNSNFGSYDGSYALTIKHGKGIYDLEVSAQNNRENRQGKFKAGINLQSPLVAGVTVRGSSLPFNIPAFDVTLDYDLSSDLKTLKGDLKALNLNYHLDAKINWSPDSSVINIAVTDGGNRNLHFKGERTGFRNMEYTLDFMGKVVRFVSTNYIQSPTDFSVNAQLELPIPEFKEIELKARYSQFVDPSKTHSLSASLEVNEHEKFSFKFDRSTSGTFELKGVTSLPQISKLEFVHLHTPNSLAEDGHTNEYNLKWNDANTIALNYKRENGVNHRHLEIIFENNKIASVTYKLRYTPGVKGFDFDLTSDSDFLNLKLELHVQEDGSFTLSAEGKSAKLSGQVASVKANYKRRKQLDVTFKRAEREATLTCQLIGDGDGNGGNLKIDFTNNFIDKFKKVHIDASAHYSAAKKAATLVLTFDGKTFSLEASASKEELELFVSTPIPGIEYLKFETEVHAGKYTAELEYGKKGTPNYLDVEVELNSKEAEVKFFKFAATRGTAGYTLSGEIDLGSMTFSSEATWPGKSVKLSSHYENGILVGDLKTPFQSFEDVRFEGQWEKTATGASFKGFGDVNSLRHAFEASYVTKEKGFSITWRASKGGADELVFGLNCEMDAARKMEAKLSLTGTAISSLLVEGKYEITGTSFTSILKFQTPYEKLAKGEAEVHVSFNHPNSYEFKAVAKTDNVIFDVDVALSLEAVDNKFLRFGAVVPALGINEDDLKIAFGYRVVSASDFELVAEASIAGTPRKAVLKYKRLEKKIDGELALQFASRNVQVRFGGQITALGPDGHTFTGYINDCKLDASHDDKNVAVKVTLDFKNKVLGIFDVVEAGMPNPINFEFKYDHLRSAKVALQLGQDPLFPKSFHASLVLGNDRVLAELGIHTWTTGRMTTAVVIEYGPRGRFEVTTKIEDTTHGLTLQGDLSGRGVRQGRAAIYSPSIGNFEFELDRSSSSGIIVLTTARGLHKVSYDIKYTASNDFEVDIQLESPFLNNGHASGKLTVNSASHNYRAMFSLNNDHFLSGSFVALTNGFEAAFGLQSSALPSEFQVAVSFSNGVEELNGSFNVQIFSNKHFIKISARKDRPYAKVVTSSPFLPWMTLDVEGDVKKENDKYNLALAVKFGSQTMQINGEFVINNYLDVTGRIYYNSLQLTGFKVSEARLSYRHKISGTQNFVDLIWTSDHPSYPEARFAVTAEIVAETKKKTILFSIVTPFAQYETLSGKISIPNCEEGKLPKKSELTAQIVLPNQLGTHEVTLALNFDKPNKKIEAKFLYTNDGIELITSEINFWTGDTYTLRAQLSTSFANFTSAKLSVDLPLFTDLRYGDLRLKVEWNEEQKIETKISYELRADECKFVTAEIEVPERGKYSIDLGRKKCSAFRAYLETPLGGLGGKLSYLIVPHSTDYDIQAEIDISLLDIYWIKYKRLGFESKFLSGYSEMETNINLNIAYKLFLDDHILSFKTDVRSMAYGDMEINLEAMLNEFYIRGNLFGTDFDSVLKITAALPQDRKVVIEGHWKLDNIASILKDNTEFTLKVDVNNQRRISLVRNSKTTTIEFRNIFTSKAIKYTQHYEIVSSGSNRFFATGEICWNTNYEKGSTEKFELKINFDPVSTMGDYIFKLYFLNGHTSTFSALNFKLSDYYGKLSYLENDVEVLQIQSEYDTFYTAGGLTSNNLKYSFILPDRKFALELKNFNWRLRQTQLTFQFGLRSEYSRMQAIVFSHTSDHEGDIFVTEKYSLRRITDTSSSFVNNGDRSIVLTMRREGESVWNENGKFSRLFGFKIDHPYDDDLRVDLTAFANGQLVGPKITFDGGLSKKVGSRDLEETSLNVEIDTSRMTLDGTLLTGNHYTYNLKSKVISYESFYGLESFVTEDGINYADLSADINTRAPSMQIQTKHGGLALFAGLQSEKEFGVKLVRNPLTDSLQLFNVYARLDESDQLLFLGAEWLPRLTTELKEAFNSLTSTLHIHIADLTWYDLEVTRKILEDFHDTSLKAVQSVLETSLSKLYDARRQFSNNLGSLQINENRYVRTVIDFIGYKLRLVEEFSSFVIENGLRVGVNALELTFDLTSSIFAHAKHIINELQEYLDIWSELSYFVRSNVDIDFNEISREINSFILSTKSRVEIFVSWYRELVESKAGQASIILKNFVKNIKNDSVVIMVQVSKFLGQFKVVEEAFNFYLEYQSWFEEIHFTQHLENAIQQLQTYVDDSTREFDSWKQSLVTIWQSAKTFFASKYESISRYPIFAYITTAGRRIYRITSAIIEQFSLDQQLQRMLEKVVGQTKSVVQIVVRVADFINNRAAMWSSEFKYEPENGILSFIQVLPFKWTSFKELPDLFKLFQSIGGDNEDGSSTGEFSFIDFQHDLLDAIHTIGTALATRSLVPPFSARAMVSGDSHLMTFDNKFYDFSGSQGCSYLLTSDFLHNRFSVIANYGEDQKRTSLTVVSDNKRIEIETKPADDGETIKVKIDRRVVELPQKFLHTHIKREGSSLILENSEGLRVVCNSAYDVCSVTVSGWYFGKTGGLFGVYDYEPSNDWMTPERRIVDSLTDFASSWQMDKSKRCPIKFQAPDTSLLSESDRDKCSDILGGDDSSLMPCYTTVDVTPFQRMCLSDAAKESGTGLCSAAASYIEHCKLSGIELWMPSECVRCNSGLTTEQPLKSGESTSYQNTAPLSADVVFLVEQTSCLERFSLSELPSVIDRELEVKGLTENRFAVVGFGGPDDLAKPHIFTSGSKIFSDGIKTSATMNSLKSTGTGGQVFGALKYAGRLPYRPGVSKSIILITCSPGNDGSFYGDAMTMLTEQAITLHHLTAGSTIQWRGSRSRPTDKIHGFSKTLVYTARNLNDFNGDSVLRKQLKDPKDFLSTLATESGGTVFTLSKFESSEALESKKSATIFGIQVALRAEPAPCQVCDCVADADGVGRLQCHKCILPAMDIVLKNWEEYQQMWTN